MEILLQVTVVIKKRKDNDNVDDDCADDESECHGRYNLDFADIQRYLGSCLFSLMIPHFDFDKLPGSHVAWSNHMIPNCRCDLPYFCCK